MTKFKNAYDMLLNSPKGDGLELWRLFVRDNVMKTSGHNRSRLMAIVSPEDVRGSYEKKKTGKQ